MCLSGGGYNKRAVAKCWAYETAVLVGQKHLVTDKLPGSDVLIKRFLKEKYFGSREVALNGDRMNLDRRGFVQTMNTEEELDATKVKALEQLRSVAPAPGGPQHKVPALLRVLGFCLASQDMMSISLGTCWPHALTSLMLDYARPMSAV